MPKRDFGFRWVTHSSETTAGHPSRHSHSDPTADAAIGNLMREKRKSIRPADTGNQSGRKTAAGRCREEAAVRENEVEKAFVDAVKKAGGKAVKFTSQTMNGVPDRLVLLPCGKCAFVELKAPGKQMRMLQRKRREQLQALGFPVFCVDRPEQIQPVMDALGEWKPGEPVPTGTGAEIPELKNMILPGGGDAE